MAPPIIINAVLLFVMMAGDALWHLWAHDPQGAKKLFAWAYMCGGIGL